MRPALRRVEMREEAVMSCIAYLGECVWCVGVFVWCVGVFVWCVGVFVVGVFVVCIRIHICTPKKSTPKYIHTHVHTPKYIHTHIYTPKKNTPTYTHLHIYTPNQNTPTYTPTAMMFPVQFWSTALLLHQPSPHPPHHTCSAVLVGDTVGGEVQGDVTLVCMEMSHVQGDSTQGVCM